MIILTENDADGILKIMRNKKQDLISDYKQLTDRIESLIISLGDYGKKEQEKYENERLDNEKYYRAQLAEYDSIIMLLTTGSEIK